MLKSDKASAIANMSWFTLALLGIGWKFIIPVDTWDFRKTLWVGVPILLYGMFVWYAYSVNNKPERSNNR